MRQRPKSDNYLLEHTRRDIQHPKMENEWEERVHIESMSIGHIKGTQPSAQAE
jgi:hypothetical protein